MFNALEGTLGTGNSPDATMLALDEPEEVD